MIVGVTIFSYLSVPQTFWQSGDPLTYVDTGSKGNDHASPAVREHWRCDEG